MTALANARALLATWDEINAQPGMRMGKVPVTARTVEALRELVTETETLWLENDRLLNHIARRIVRDATARPEDDFGDASIGRAMAVARERGEDIDNMPNPSRIASSPGGIGFLRGCRREAAPGVPANARYQRWVECRDPECGGEHIPLDRIREAWPRGSQG